MSKGVLVCLALALCVSYASCYNLVDNYSGSNFFNMWQFFTGGDPTHGYVHYLGQGDAQNQGLISVTDNVVYIRSDHSNVASGAGRNSVRLTSKKVYTNGLFIIDLRHMPYGCGNWPAIWTVGPNWPYGGEIDIIEGVNLGRQNQMTLHSGPGCTMPSNWNQQGTQLTTDCNSANGANGNEGCGVRAPSTQSFGSGFNSNGGGVYAMQWSKTGVFIWFFTRNSVPADITNGNPDTTKWGTPTASFPFAGTGPGSCAASNFQNQQIVIDNTFCGDWAGNTFNGDGCSGSCQSFVQNNPGSFTEAYWAINSIKVYQ